MGAGRHAAPGRRLSGPHKEVDFLMREESRKRATDRRRRQRAMRSAPVRVIPGGKNVEHQDQSDQQDQVNHGESPSVRPGPLAPLPKSAAAPPAPGGCFARRARPRRLPPTS